MDKTFNFADLFAGTGGFRLGLEAVGGRCVFSSEIDEKARQTYQDNFKEEPSGDITAIEASTIPSHDILCAGFPCQPFSISGHKKGFEDTRGTLFFHIQRIAREKRPEVLFLENVKHLKYHDDGRTLETIVTVLEELGYRVSWKVLNAKNFGVPQNRQRLVFVASRGQKFEFSHLTAREATPEMESVLQEEGDFEVLPASEYTIIPREVWKQQRSGLIFCGYLNKNIRKNGVNSANKHLSRVHRQPNRIYYYKGTHPTIPSQETSGRFWIYDDQKVRKLTIEEVYRLMGFPEDFKIAETKSVAYRQAGNAIVPLFVETIGGEIIKQLF